MREMGTSSRSSSVPEASHPYPQHIPEGVSVTHCPDPSRPRLPIFGQRVASVSRASSCSSGGISNATSCSEGKLRLQVDQLEHQLREKLLTKGFITLQRLFSKSLPEAQSQVDRDGLLMILIKFLGRFITLSQFKQLLLRLHLSEKPSITPEDLCGALGVSTRAPSHPNKLQTASQALSVLHGEAQDRFLDAVDCFAEKNNINGGCWISADELRNLLETLDIHMESQEFVKFWKRCDQEGRGAARMDMLLKSLGAKSRKRKNSEKNKGEDVKTAAAREATELVPPSLSEAEEEHRVSIAVEKWMKERLREGAQKMRAEFDKLDPGKTGKVSCQAFLQTLGTLGLHLKPAHLGTLLARCGLQVRKSGINYRRFLQRFQDRSDEGVTHQILQDPKHRFHHQNGSPSHASSVSAAEAELTRLFHTEYLALLAAFQSIDKMGKKTLSPEEFRAVLESRFRLEMSNSQFEQLLENLPLDADGNVQYTLFMAPFDSRGGAPSLLESQCDSTTSHESKDLVHLKPDGGESGDAGKSRNNDQLFQVIKVLVRQQFPAVQAAFEELDERNTRRLTQESMYHLLRRFDIRPEVSRGEIRRLWRTLITNRDQTLDFLQFVRHFGHSPQSACFPNAKVSPPQRGDENLRLRSRKLVWVSDILVDSVRAKVDLIYPELQRQFEEMDPYGTGFVSQEEFKEILGELSVHLSEYECDMLAKKFETNSDGRVSYVEFLKPFAESRRHVLKQGANMAAVLHSYRGPKNEKSDRGILRTALRKKVQAERHSLRRAFRTLDRTGSGRLPPAEIRAVLKLHGFTLSEEEEEELFARAECGGGRVDFERFLLEACGSRAGEETASLSWCV